MGTNAGLLAGSARACLTAPAGYGKTYLIAEAVATCCDGRQLLLTHTHAGIRAMRAHLTKMNCPRSRYQVETISGWALRYAAAYPSLSGFGGAQPTTGKDWRKVYLGAARLLDVSAIRRVVQLSYSGAFVDEYQDCTKAQHALVERLSAAVPCRVLGDPLQGIFGFGEDQAVDWHGEVERDFHPLPRLQIPYRWQGHNTALGSWLSGARSQIEGGRPVDLRQLPAGITWRAISGQTAYETQRQVCYESLRHGGTVAAIHEGTKEAPCHTLARSLGGSFQCMEPVDCKDLYKWADQVGATEGDERAVRLVDFACICLTRVKTELKSIRKRFSQGPPKRGTGPRKHRGVLHALEEVARSSSLRPAGRALKLIRAVPGAVLYRRELWDSFSRSISEFENAKSDSLLEAARRVRDVARRAGRAAEPRTVSRTLLVKGLEYDHSIVLDADSLDRKQLYVALTRGSRRLTVLSKEPVLRPR